jgi:thiol:disulfide interchange protein
MKGEGGGGGGGPGGPPPHPAITAALARHGRNGVPLYLVFRPGVPEPAVLPELLTVATVVDALR